MENQVIETNNGKQGGLVAGLPHNQGGVKAVLVDNGAPLEVEKNEVVVTKPAVLDPSQHQYQGTNKEVLNEMNTAAGGNPILEKGGVIQPTWSIYNNLYLKIILANFGKTEQ